MYVTRFKTFLCGTFNKFSLLKVINLIIISYVDNVNFIM